MFWQAEVATLLPEFEPGRLTIARSINDSEAMVGFQGTDRGAIAPLWLHGVAYSLTDLIDRVIRQSRS